jgi:TPR repeat protein
MDKSIFPLFFSKKASLFYFFWVLLFCSQIVYSQTYETALHYFKLGNLDKALPIWTELAKEGDINSQFSLGIFYEQQGKYLSHEKSIKYLQLAADQNMEKAQYHLAMKYFSGYGVEQNFSKTLQLLRQAAAEDSPEAQYQLGRMAADGLGMKVNLTEAIRWYVLAAENGFGLAQHTLASHYMTGNGTEVNVSKAVLWLKRAAEQHNILAQRDLGFLYTQGMGVDKNYVLAAQLLEEPAQQGSPVSRYLLGQIYAEGGYGLTQSIRSAKYWFNQAMEVGYPKAASALQQIAYLPSEPLEPESIKNELVEKEHVEQTIEESGKSNSVDIEQTSAISAAGDVLEIDSELNFTSEIEKSESLMDSSDQQEINSHERMANLVDPSTLSSTQLYDFYNEDLSAYRSTNSSQQGTIVASEEGEWEYTGKDIVADLKEEQLIEYDDIDKQFDAAFSSGSKSMGRRHYKQIFGLTQGTRSEYTIRTEKNYIPNFLSVAENNDKSHSKAAVFRRHSDSGKALSLFSKELTAQSAQQISDAKNKRALQADIEKQQRNTQFVNYTAAKYAPVSYPDNNLDNDSARFRTLPSGYFTLQILQSNQWQIIQKIIQNPLAKEDGHLYVLSIKKKEGMVYIIVYGAYSSHQKAKQAATSLPSYIAIGTPWIRQINILQQQLKVIHKGHLFGVIGTVK